MYQKIITRIKLLVVELCVLSTLLAMLICLAKLITSPFDGLSKIIEVAGLFSMIFFPLSIIQYILIYLCYGKKAFDKTSKIAKYRRFLFWLFMMSILSIMFLLTDRFFRIVLDLPIFYIVD